ncbi:hypothetical protein RJG79_08245 [Mycoplasmatota bacterium WC44]
MAFILLNKDTQKKENVSFATVRSYMRDVYPEDKIPYVVYDLFENKEIECGNYKIEYVKEPKMISHILGIESE